MIETMLEREFDDARDWWWSMDMSKVTSTDAGDHGLFLRKRLFYAVEAFLDSNRLYYLTT